MSGFRDFVVQRIPVISLPNAPPDRGPVVEPPDVGARWGKASYINFEDTTSNGDTGSGFHLTEGENERIDREGSGVKEATDRDGTKVAESNLNVWHTRTLFSCGKFDEKTEEVRQVGNVKFITPIITHVDLYVEWGDVVPFGIDEVRIATGAE